MLTKAVMSPAQSLAKLQERFHLGHSVGRSEPDLRSSPGDSHLSLSRQTLDAGSQTSISGDVSDGCGRAGLALPWAGLHQGTDVCSPVREAACTLAISSQ